MKTFISFVLAVASLVFSAQTFALQTVRLPVGKNGETIFVRVELLDNQRRPIVIVNHGDRSGNADAFRRGVKETFGMSSKVVEYWHSKGFHVVSPLRRGYGSSGNSYGGDFGPCSRPRMYDAIASQAEDVIAAAKWANSQQWSSGQMILEGQSGGGSAVVAAAAYNEPYIKGVVNFSGLRGSQDNGVPCGLEQQNEIMRSIGRATRTPQLWIYANNDAKIRADIATQWANIVNSSGGNVKLLITKSIMKENGGDDGHSVMSHKELYEAQLNSFLSSVLSNSSASSPMAYRNNKTNQFAPQNGTIKIIRYNVNTNM